MAPPTRQEALDAVGDAMADAMATLTAPTDGLNQPMTPLSHEELTAARTALRLVVTHLNQLKDGLGHQEVLRLERRAGL